MNEMDCLPDDVDQDNTFRQTVFNPEQAVPSKMISPIEKRVQQIISPRGNLSSNGPSATNQTGETIKYLNNMQWQR